MAELPATRPSLLIRLRDPRDQEAWRQFVRLYGPLVYRYGRRRGLQDADAADLTQVVLRAVSAGAGRLDGDGRRGPFRSWLFAVAHHKLHDLLARQGRAGRGSGDPAVQGLLEEQPARPEDQEAWDQEYERRLFVWAGAEVRLRCQDTTWQAFWLCAIEGKSGKEVAEALGINVAAVYLAKSRVMARLREEIRLLEGD
jgi:RNA polymerase sigma factor (sigma-70 family)